MFISSGESSVSGFTSLSPIRIDVTAIELHVFIVDIPDGLKHMKPLSDPIRISPSAEQMAALVNLLSKIPSVSVKILTPNVRGLNSTRPLSDESQMLPKQSSTARKNTLVGNPGSVFVSYTVNVLLFLSNFAKPELNPTTHILLSLSTMTEQILLSGSPEESLL